ncbi:Helix-turn-helix [Chryseolinea serpens]|jgi:DNA-binding XRE family transcriptional regulator|uniref:Helix-turn-helix n=1 Tax=Chryseolinea serpens TaxID=947013 RepID=A0A1M5U8L9_9BACT|nr:helix-turn-helix transcriptional regulator [Chryseolinea serpens]SHH59405.1 Helix-turn-helix [Chryseolinea serpens]
MKSKLKTYTLDQVKDEMIGKRGTPRRDEYEFELTLELLGEMIKTTRQQRHLTQEQLGKLVGVQKAQISKLEKNATNVTVGTVLRIFDALKAKINFRIELENKRISTPEAGLG